MSEVIDIEVDEIDLPDDLDIVIETATPIRRKGGSGGPGREPTKWEAILHKVGVFEHQGQDIRLFTFDTQAKARSRATGIRARLNKVMPLANVQMKVRPLDVDAAGDPAEGTKWGCYIHFVGNFTQEQYEARQAAIAEKSEKQARTRAANGSTTGRPPAESHGEAPEASPKATKPASSAAAKVAAAKARKAG